MNFEGMEITILRAGGIRSGQRHPDKGQTRGIGMAEEPKKVGDAVLNLSSLSAVP